MAATDLSSIMQAHIARKGCLAPKKNGRNASTFVIRPRFRMLLLLMLISLLAACSAGPSAASAIPTPTRSTPKPTTQPAGTVLYQSNWSNGLTDWQASVGWHVVGNYVQTDLGDNRTLTVPYTPRMLNYAVEFRLQVISVPQDGGYFMLTADPVAGKDGYQAHVLGLLDSGQHSFAIHPLSEVVIDPASDQIDDDNPQVFDYEPGHDWHTYRVEVRDTQVLFFVDNVRVSRASSVKTGALSDGPIRLRCGKAVLAVNDFRVIAL